MLCRPTQLASTPVSNPILYRPTQLAPSLVSNVGLYCFNSKIQDNCKCIPMRLMAPASLMQASLTQVAPMQAPLIQAPLLQALSIQLQPVAIRISNPAPPTSKFRKDYKCIPERSTVLTLSTQALLIQVFVPQASKVPIQAPPTQVQVFLTQRPPA